MTRRQITRAAYYYAAGAIYHSLQLNDGEQLMTPLEHAKFGEEVRRIADTLSNKVRGATQARKTDTLEAIIKLAINFKD